MLLYRHPVIRPSTSILDQKIDRQRAETGRRGKLHTAGNASGASFKTVGKRIIAWGQRASVEDQPDVIIAVAGGDSYPIRIIDPKIENIEFLPRFDLATAIRIAFINAQEAIGQDVPLKGIVNSQRFLRSVIGVAAGIQLAKRA